MISWDLVLFNFKLLAEAQCDMCCISFGIVLVLIAGTSRYVSSAYLHRRLVDEKVDISEAVKTYSTGPKAEPWIILALMGSYCLYDCRCHTVHCFQLCGKCSDPPASRLLQVKMNIIPYYDCRILSGSSIINNTAHICIGSVPTSDVGICKVSVHY